MIIVDKVRSCEITTDFSGLEARLDCTNYSNALCGKKFFFKKNSDFNTFNSNFLDELFEEPNKIYLTEQVPCEGFIKAISFDAAQGKVANFFSYEPTGTGSLVSRPGSKEHEERVREYWEIIQLHFALPPTRCFEYIPTKDAFLGVNTPWSCMFILVDDMQSCGLFLSLETNY